MAIRTYDADISVLIVPRWFGRKPTGRIGVDGVLTEFQIGIPTWFDFHICRDSDSICHIQVDHYGKTDADTITGSDTALIIEQVKLNGIMSDKFTWEGEYRPEYPLGWIQQNEGNELPPILKPHTYLGWNGTWTLEVTLPLYTWIHKLENLGWIYD